MRDFVDGSLNTQGCLQYSGRFAIQVSYGPCTWPPVCALSRTVIVSVVTARRGGIVAATCRLQQRYDEGLRGKVLQLKIRRR
jgi:hypothetical protein